MQENLVSIIIPVYKAEKTISRCLDSVLKQTYQNYEIILIDDGSPDACPAICDNYAERYDKIRVFHQKNGGVSKARNTGIEKVNGQYVIFIDADDYIKENYICQLINNRADLVVCGYSEIFDNGELIEEKKYEHSYHVTRERINFLELYKQSSMFSPWCKLFTTAIILNNNIRFDEELSCGEDAKFVIDYLNYIDTLSVLEYVGYTYIIDKNSNTLSSRLTEDLLERFKKSREYCIHASKKLDIELSDFLHESGKSECAYYLERLFLSNISMCKKNKMIHSYLKNSYIKETLKNPKKYYFSRSVLAYLTSDNPREIMTNYKKDNWNKILKHIKRKIRGLTKK